MRFYAEQIDIEVCSGIVMHVLEHGDFALPTALVYDATCAFANMALAQREDRELQWRNMVAYMRARGLKRAGKVRP